MRIQSSKWWFRINGYGLSFSTYDMFSIRNGRRGKLAQWTQKNLGFHINILSNNKNKL